MDLIPSVHRMAPREEPPSVSNADGATWSEGLHQLNRFPTPGFSEGTCVCVCVHVRVPEKI